jgi:hypothetical protein
MMRLPKFWRHNGTWNDSVVSTAILLALGGWVGLGWWLESPGLMRAAVFLGPVTGLGLGLGVVALLCEFFVERKA